MTNIEDFIRDGILSGLPEENDILEYVRTHYPPQEVFDDKALHLWALNNGFDYKDHDCKLSPESGCNHASHK